MNIEIIGYIAGILTTVCFVPQVVKIMGQTDNSGVSVSMYIIILLGEILWVIYGFVIDSYPVIIPNLVCVGLNSCIIYKLFKK